MNIEIKDQDIFIDDKLLLTAVLTDNDGNYVVYGHRKSSVPEVAFEVMIIIRTLITEGHIKNKAEFDKLVKKYFNDPQYAPVEVNGEKVSGNKRRSN